MSNINTFDSDTSEELRRLILRLNATRERVRIFYGDIKTGTAWAEEKDVLGRIGCSTGTSKIPLLISNARSSGGGGLLDGCIVAIWSTKGHRLYKHPTFSTGTWDQCAPVSDGYVEAVAHDGKLHAQFKKVGQAARYVLFMRGVRFSK
jgi:hypothetical protein